MKTNNLILIITLVVIFLVIISLILYFTLKSKHKNYIYQKSGTIEVTDAYNFEGIDISGYSKYSIEGKSSDINNSDSLDIETSPDNNTWFKTDLYLSPLQGGYYFYNSNLHTNYLRISFKNTTVRTSIELYITLKK